MNLITFLQPNTTKLNIILCLVVNSAERDPKLSCHRPSQEENAWRVTIWELIVCSSTRTVYRKVLPEKIRNKLKLKQIHLTASYWTEKAKLNTHN